MKKTMAILSTLILAAMSASVAWACHSDTQDWGAPDFSGISGGWLPTQDAGMYPEPDVFVFAMGTNDGNLGSAEEALKGKNLDDVDVTTMAGGARWSIQTIIERFPNCRVFVCTPIQTSTPEHNAKNLKKIEILKEIRNNYF